MNVDRFVFEAINGWFTSPVLDLAAALLSWAGTYGAMWLVVIGFLGSFGLRRRNVTVLGIAVGGFVAFAISAPVGEVIESLVSRPRPFDVLPDVRTLVAEKDSFSFPSGTTTAAFAPATGMLLVGRKLLGEVRWWGWAMLAVAVATGLSRVYVGMHWPTDVLAGAALGIVAGWVGASVAEPVSRGIVSFVSGESRRVGRRYAPSSRR